MQDNRNDGEDSTRQRANPSPPVGNVCGLGESHALRVELRPVQLPWLCDEIDELRRPIEEAVAVERARYDQLTAGGADPRSPEACETDTEIARRNYQLKVLAMIREQLPIDDEAVTVGVASPWQAKDEDPNEPGTIGPPVEVLGPAHGMLVLIRGAARNVTAALAEALAPAEPDAFGIDQSRVRRSGERRRITAPVAVKLRSLAAAAEAFVDTYVNVVALNSYSFDPDYYPVVGDELWQRRPGWGVGGLHRALASGAPDEGGRPCLCLRPGTSPARSAPWSCSRPSRARRPSWPTRSACTRARPGGC